MICSTFLLIVLLALDTAAGTGDFKKGTYSVTAGGVKWSLRYDDNSKVTVSRDGSAVVEGTYKVTGDLLEVTDEKGPMACGGEQKTGKYKWKLEGKNLTFTKVEDECGGRANAMTGQTWLQE
jgi:hypothetical protein